MDPADPVPALPSPAAAAAVSLLLPGAGHLWLALALQAVPEEEARVGDLVLRGIGLLALSFCCLPCLGHLLAAFDAHRQASALHQALCPREAEEDWDDDEDWEDEDWEDEEDMEPAQADPNDPYALEPQPTRAELLGERFDLRDDVRLGDNPYPFVDRASLRTVKRILTSPEGESRREEVLFAALDRGRGALVGWLLEVGTPVDAVDEEGRSLLAAALPHPPLVEMLLAAGADPTADPNLLQDPFAGAERSVEILLEAGADPNQGPRLPLLCAVAQSSPRVVRALLAAGAGADVTDEAGVSALDEARLVARSTPGPRSREVLRLLGETDPGAPEVEVPALEPVRRILAPHARPGWRPRVRAGEGEPTGSRYGGRPWLPDGTWPTGPGGRPLTPILQLDLAALPAPLGTGLLQVLEDPDAPLLVGGPAHLRAVSPEAGSLAEPPEGAEVPEAFEILAFEPLEELPGIAEVAEGALEGIVPFEDPLIEWEGLSRLGLHLEGDKLGGWPAWLQGPETPACPTCGSRAEHLVAQLVRGPTETDSHPWADLGALYVFRCAAHPDRFAAAFQT